MKTVQITEDAVLKAHSEGTKKQKSLLENLFSGSVFNKDIKGIIQDLNSVIDYLGKNDTDVLDYFQLKKMNIADQIIAYQELVLIVKAYNETKIPDYTDSSQAKYHPRFKLSSSSGVGFSFNGYDSWVTLSLVGSRLDFLNYDNMKDAVAKFLPFYQRWVQSQNNN